MKKTYSMMFEGRELTVELGELAQQANGSVFVSYGETQVLVTACLNNEPRSGVDFFPLSVEFEEKMYAVGKIPGSFLRREGRASEKATLSARLIDRPLRPLFNKGYRNEVQIVATVMSVEFDVLPEIAALFGASLALSISDIPFDGPAAGVQVGYVDGRIIINPDSAQREASLLDLTVAGIEDGIMMVEAGAKEVSEAVMIQAIMTAQEAIRKLVAFQNGIVAENSKPKKDIPCFEPSAEIRAAIGDKPDRLLGEALKISDKAGRNERIEEISSSLMQEFLAVYPDNKADIEEIVTYAVKKVMRSVIIGDRVRPDGRGLDEIRPISCEVSKLKRVHGSGLFNRGQTQVLSTVTLGNLRDEQIIDNLTAEESKRYMHHYNFPPFSVGETRPLRGPGRREIGHGALAERALEPLIPDITEFPYAIRVVSEVLGSHGSTSQASVCGSTLALMDAGVPIKAAAAGIAMGLIKEGSEIAILSDIQDIEDYYGDMDFKVAGTSRGITAMQMDIKIRGVEEEVLSRALEQARDGRIFILGKMLETLPAPRPDVKEFAPRILTMQIAVDKIREVIGTGGKVINRIIDETGVKIDIMDDGMVYIASPDMESAVAAQKIIEDIVRDFVIGDEYTGPVRRILPIGAFVELPGGKEGLVHISKLAKHHVNKVEDEVSIGDMLNVKIIEIKNGKIDLRRIL